MRGRKWPCNQSKWKTSERKRLRQSGKKYKNYKGNVVPEKQITLNKNCNSCKFKCRSNFSLNDIQKVHDEFWALSDNEKLNFYDKTTERKKKRESVLKTEIPKKQELSRINISLL